MKLTSSYPLSFKVELLVDHNPLLLLLLLTGGITWTGPVGSCFGQLRTAESAAAAADRSGRIGPAQVRSSRGVVSSKEMVETAEAREPTP